MKLAPAPIKHPRPGRPSKSPTALDFRDSKLHALLADAFPSCCNRPDEQDDADTKTLNIRKFSRLLGCTRYAVYRWCGGEKMSSQSAAAIVAKSDGRLRREDLLPFLF